jgi:hypothetical protein
MTQTDILDAQTTTAESVGVDAASLAVYTKLTTEWRSTQSKSVEVILMQASIIDRAYQQAEIEDQANTGKGKFGSVTVRPGFDGFLKSISMGERTAKEYKQLHRSDFLKDVNLCGNYEHVPASLKVLLQLSRIEISDCTDGQRKRDEFAGVIAMFEASHVSESAFVTVAIATDIVDGAVARLTGMPRPERIKTTLSDAGLSIPVPAGANRVLIERKSVLDDDGDQCGDLDEEAEPAAIQREAIRDEEHFEHVKMTAKVMAKFADLKRANELKRKIEKAVLPILSQYDDITYCVQLYKLGEALEPEVLDEELTDAE